MVSFNKKLRIYPDKYPDNVEVKEKIWFLAKGYSGITLRLWPIANKIFIRKYTSFGRLRYKKRIWDIIDHENIHWKQQIELPYIFYIVYAIEWIFKSIKYFNIKDGYRNISFEREAFYHEKNSEKYLKTRKPYAWLKYIFKDPFKK